MLEIIIFAIDPRKDLINQFDKMATSDNTKNKLKLIIQVAESEENVPWNLVCKLCHNFIHFITCSIITVRISEP